MTRVLVSGAGGFGLTWIPGLKRAGVSVVGVVDPSQAAADAFLDGLAADAPSFSSLGQAVSVVDADFVIDSSPFRYRLTNAELAFEAGMDFLGAKPLGGSLAQTERIVSAARDAGRRLGAAMQMRFFPCFVSLREVVSDMRFGLVRRAEIRMSLDGRGWVPGMEWRLGLTDPLLLEAGIHHADLMRWVFCQELNVVACFASNPPWSPFKANANVDALLELNAAPITYAGHFAPHPSAKPVRFDSGWHVEFDDAIVTVCNGGVFADGELIAGEVASEPSPLERLNIGVLDLWLNGQTDDESGFVSGDEYLQSMRLLDVMLRESRDEDV